MNLGVLRKLFYGVPKDFRGQSKVLLVQRQVATGQISLPQIRVGPFRLVEKILQHQLGFRAQPQRRLAQRDQVRGVAIQPSAPTAPLVDFLQEGPRPIRVPVGGRDFATEQEQADTGPITRQGVGQRGLRLGVSSRGQQRLRQQRGPFLLAPPVTAGFLAEARDQARLLDERRRRRRARPHEPRAQRHRAAQGVRVVGADPEGRVRRLDGLGRHGHALEPEDRAGPA